MSEYTAERAEHRANHFENAGILDIAAMLRAYAATLRQQATNPPEIGSKLVGDGAVSDEVRLFSGDLDVLANLGFPKTAERIRAVLYRDVAPLLRAPAEQGGRVDGFEDWWERTESDASSPHDAAKSAWQAASAQNAQGEAVAVVGRAGPSRGALFWLPEGQKADLPDGTKLYTHADLQNAQREDWRIGMFERWRERAQELGFAGIAEAVEAHAEHARVPESKEEVAALLQQACCLMDVINAELKSLHARAATPSQPEDAA